MMKPLKIFICSVHDTMHDIIHHTAHHTAHDTLHDKKYIEITSLPGRLLLIMQGEMSRSDMIQKLELTHRSNFKENYLDIALDMDWIEMTFPKKNKSKKQKYRLTQLLVKEQQKIHNEFK